MPKSIRLLCVVSLVFLSACKPTAPASWTGYVEGEYLYLAAPVAGRIEHLSVQAGQTVAKAAPLFELEREAEMANLNETKARQLTAKAQANNTQKGKRSDEIAVIEAQLRNALVQEKLTQTDLARQQKLVDQAFVSKARLDDAQTQVQIAQGRVAELRASLKVARLPSRNDEQIAADANAQAASEVVKQSAWRNAQKSQIAPAHGLIADIFFRPGEYVAAGQPVLSLLPPENVKLRFFVPEAELGQLQIGQAVQVNCDACGPAQKVHITRIARQADYTPPVIYSNAQRSKLVFMVEAHLDAVSSSRLNPGQAIDVRRSMDATPVAKP